MKYLVRACLFLTLVLGETPLLGQDSTPKYSNEFLSLGAGARSFGMAKAQVSIVSDVTSSYWNPAGLTGIKSNYEFAFMHSEFFAGIAKYDYLGFSTRIDSLSVLGISAIRFGVDDIPDTRFLYDANGALNYDNILLFSAADYAFIFSYARDMGFLPGLSLGANFKIVYRNVGSFANAWGFGLDVGGQYQAGNWLIGAMFRDVTGTFTVWSHNTDNLQDIYTQTGNIIPQTTLEITLPRLIIGVGRRFVIKEKWGLLPALDLITTFDGKRNVLIKSSTISVDPVIGLEMDYKKLAFIRVGAGNFQEIKDFDGSKSLEVQPSIGLGVRIKKLDVDYALTDMGNESESMYSHIFSLTVRLDK
jgi:hypothetical protein